MTTKIVIPNLDNLVSLYQSGKSVNELSRQWGISHQTVTRNLKRLGVYSDRTGFNRKSIPGMGTLVNRYATGESVNILAKETGVGRYAMTSALERAGVALRDQSAAESAKWQRMTAGQRIRQVKAAHAATLGIIPSFAAGCAQARSREITGKCAPHERLLARWLADLGVAFTPQKAVGPYNIDIALDACPVAVEIFGGGWHAYGRHATRHMERVVYLLNNGWHVLIVWTDNKSYPLAIDAANHVVAQLERLSKNPTLPREYGVILGNGDFATSTRSKFNDRATVEALGCTFNVSGHNHHVAG